MADDERPPHAFAVTVVGDESVMTPGDLVALLDLLVNRHTSTRRIWLVTPGGVPTASEWARHRDCTSVLVPKANGWVRRDCELAALADALVVLGDPAPWRFLIDLCKRAGTPYRVYTGRPKLPPRARPAWDVSEE